MVQNITPPNLYEAPLVLGESNSSSAVCRELGIGAPCIQPGLARRAAPLSICDFLAVK